MILVESLFDVNILSEAVNNGKDWYIEGIFMQSDVVNRNRRLYPDAIMEREVESYKQNYVATKRAVGELSHPDNIEINLDKITHLTESISKEGKNYIGRAKILNTTAGKEVKALLEGGVQLGVSSRALGSVKLNEMGINEVQKDFSLRAIDIVFHPSAPDALVRGLLEGASFVHEAAPDAEELIEQLKAELNNKKAYQLAEKRLEAFNKFMSVLSGKA